MAIEIVVFPSYNMVIFHSYVKLPESMEKYGELCWHCYGIPKFGIIHDDCLRRFHGLIGARDHKLVFFFWLSTSLNIKFTSSTQRERHYTYIYIYIYLYILYKPPVTTKSAQPSPSSSSKARSSAQPPPPRATLAEKMRRVALAPKRAASPRKPPRR